MLNSTAKIAADERSRVPIMGGFHRNAYRITKVTDGGSGLLPIISPVKINPLHQKAIPATAAALPGRWHNEEIHHVT